MSASPAEIIGLTQSIAYAQHLAEQAGRHGPAGNEGYLLRLQAARVTGAGLTTGSAMQQAFAAAAAAAAGHAAELDKQTTVQEAYDQAPDTGDKTYLTDHASDGTAPDASDEQETSTPVTDPDPEPDDELAEAAAFIAATTSSHPQRPPAGRDLQHRPAEGYQDEDGEQPWMSLPVRSTVACQHVDTVCRECLESWSWGHDLRVTEVPITVDVDAHRGAADEFYTFAGDPERDLPPYWVARHGRTVTSQIAGDPVKTTLLGGNDFASAEFAEGCCDNTPGAPGEVRAGDRIEVFGNHPGGERELTVTASTATDSGGYTVTGTDGEGRPVSVTVNAWQYKIARRPVGTAR